MSVHVLSGTYGYTLFGYTHALNVEQTAYDPLPNSVTIQVAGELPPVAGGGFPGYPGTPNKQSLPAGIGWPALPTFNTVSSPVPAADLKSPTGYFPTSEIGCFHFELGGTVTGAVRFSAGGHADADDTMTFDGFYKFNGPPMAVGGKIIPMGVITIRPANKPRIAWDYSFIVIDDTEIMLASAGRMPRPGVLVGAMKRIHAPILTPGGSGSRKG